MIAAIFESFSPAGPVQGTFAFLFPNFDNAVAVVS